jgi:hypothetical protein
VDSLRQRLENIVGFAQEVQRGTPPGDAHVCGGHIERDAKQALTDVATLEREKAVLEEALRAAAAESCNFALDPDCPVADPEVRERWCAPCFARAALSDSSQGQGE